MTSFIVRIYVTNCIGWHDIKATVKGWSSMHALIIIAFFDAQFDIALTGTDMKSAQTVSDLYAIVKAKSK